MTAIKNQVSSRLFRISTIALTVATFAQNASSGQFDWPQWQGPDRTAHSKETGLVKEWPKGGPPLAWKAKDLGGGDSAPSVAAGRIFGMSNRGGDEVVWALSEKDAKEMWAVRIAPALSQSWPQSKEGPSATPTVDGDRLYVMGLAGNVACLQASDGKVIWQRNLVADFGGRSPMWSFRESPLVDGEKVICTPGGEETTMVALSKLNGETIWKSFVPDRAGGGQSQNRGPGGGGPSAMQSDPVLSALDKDHNKEISAEELAAAPAVLLELDKNKDGKLSEDEVSPQRGDSQGNRPGPRRGPGIMRMLRALSALDTNEDGLSDEAETKKAVAGHKKLDVNHDGKLTEDEVGMKYMGPQNTGAAYSSAIAIDFGGQRQYIQLLAMTVAGVSAADEKLLWRYDTPANSMHINISTSLYHEGYDFAASACGARCG